jgi:hypothetical protein
MFSIFNSSKDKRKFFTLKICLGLNKYLICVYFLTRCTLAKISMKSANQNHWFFIKSQYQITKEYMLRLQPVELVAGDWGLPRSPQSGKMLK